MIKMSYSPTTVPDVIYVFKKSKDVITLAEVGEYPKLFYGLFEIKKLLNASFIDATEERDELSYLNKAFKVFKSKLKVSDSFSHFSQETINNMNKAKVIYATTDGLALSLASLKKKNILEPKLVVNLMALFDNPVYLNKIKYLDYVDEIVVFTFPLATELKKLGYQNITFTPLGTDTSFYKPHVCKNLDTKSAPVILGIGLDNKRDWDIFKRAANEMKYSEFRVVTHNKLKKEFFGYDNITFLGNVSFLETRREICGSNVLFLPTEENFYFSGQTTLFNALSMKKPVVMPYDTNFEKYELDKTLFYNRNCSLGQIINLIEMAIKGDKRAVKSIEFNHNIVIQEYNQIKLAERLRDVFIDDIT